MTEEEKREYHRIYNRVYHQTHKKEEAAYNLVYRKNNKEKVKIWDKAIYQRLREKVFDHYGWVCKCCGEIEPAFLTIDHVDNGGTQHRKEIGGGTCFYRWLIKNNFPEEFQTLCWNCNCGRKLDICPHKKVKVL